MKTIGLLGKQLGHSFSRKYFENKFHTESIKGFQYLNFEIDSIDKLDELIEEYKPIGFNVTIPYKEQIINCLDELSPEAKSVGAVNTVLIDYSNDKIKLTGHNTDVFGFAQSIKPFLEGSHEKALVLGTGGASKAIAYVLKNLGIEVVYVSRNPILHNEISYSTINEYVIKFCPLIVNTTPVGTYPNVDERLDFPTKHLTASNLVVDLIYNPEETNLLKEAKKQGAKTLNGLSMLHQQAEKAWELFKNN